MRPHRSLAHAHEAQPWGRHQGFLGACDYHINAPLVRPQGAGSKPGDCVYNRDHVLGSPGETLDVVHRTGGGLGEDAYGGLDLGLSGERVGDLVVVSLDAPVVLEFGDIQAERLAHLHPAVPKVAVVQDEHLIAGREEVLDRTLKSPRSARRVGENVILCKKDPFQVLVHPREYLAELRRAVMDDR